MLLLLRLLRRRLAFLRQFAGARAERLHPLFVQQMVRVSFRKSEDYCFNAAATIVVDSQIAGAWASRAAPAVREAGGHGFCNAVLLHNICCCCCCYWLFCGRLLELGQPGLHPLFVKQMVTAFVVLYYCVVDPSIAAANHCC
jgi:hypothetical protein